jgi:nitrite reductase/ring-hydroxylating ferredoxin subunit
MEQPLVPIAEIPEDGTLTVDFFGREVLVYKVDGNPRAVANVCAHLGGPLHRCGDRFVCAWHEAEFDIRSDERVSGPARRDSRLMVLPTIVRNGVLTYVWNTGRTDPA